MFVKNSWLVCGVVSLYRASLGTKILGGLTVSTLHEVWKRHSGEDFIEMTLFYLQVKRHWTLAILPAHLGMAIGPRIIARLRAFQYAA